MFHDDPYAQSFHPFLSNFAIPKMKGNLDLLELQNYLNVLNQIAFWIENQEEVDRFSKAYQLIYDMR